MVRSFLTFDPLDAPAFLLDMEVIVSWRGLFAQQRT
jgi:hypothetical protein